MSVQITAAMMVSLVPEGDGKITHVSDTALMVAACRAHENELEDAYVRDPFATRLAGERGVAILDALSHANVLHRNRHSHSFRRRDAAGRARHVPDRDRAQCWLRPRHSPVAPRSFSRSALDRNRADVLDYKDRHMSGEKSRRCRERLTVDLNDAAQRRAMYEAAGASPLMITEGLLLYLPAATVDALDAEASTLSGIAHWISDIRPLAFSKVLGGGADTMQSIRHVRAADALYGEEILEVLKVHGWTTSATRSYIHDVGFVLERVRRSLGDAPPPRPGFPENDPTGVHRFGRER